jgi:anti-anti-sigma regulatory factor
MAPVEQPKDQLKVAVHNRMAFVQVSGRGSFKVCPALKQFGFSATKAGCQGVVFDLAECLGMDSTFMGVLAGLAFRLQETGSGDVVLVNVSPRNQGLLTTLGLDQAVKVHVAGATPEAYRKVLESGGGASTTLPVAGNKRTTVATMLEAHEDLVELSPENLPKFKDVLIFLREDLERTKREGGQPP